MGAMRYAITASSAYLRRTRCFYGKCCIPDRLAISAGEYPTNDAS